jgi:lysine-specific demethylase/histidyl-hydroxylase NO66
VLLHFSQGATIVLQALHRYWRPLTYFCRELEIALTHPVQTNVYLTPPSARGLDVHYDTHDVFVLQISGIKHWQVWGRAVEQPLSHQRRKGKISPPGAAEIDVELKSGDSLYVPRGVLHAAETVAHESAHMTIGILALTWMDIVKLVVRRAEEEVWLRQSLPPGFAHEPEAYGAHAGALLERLARWLAAQDASELVDEAARRFWQGRAPVLAGQLEELLEVDEIGDESLIRRRRGAVCMARSMGEELELLLGDRTVVMPAFVEPAVRLILEGGELRVRELEPWLDAEGRAVLARRLVTEGLVERVGGGDRD